MVLRSGGHPAQSGFLKYLMRAEVTNLSPAQGRLPRIPRTHFSFLIASYRCRLPERGATAPAVVLFG